MKNHDIELPELPKADAEFGEPLAANSGAVLDSRGFAVCAGLSCAQSRVIVEAHNDCTPQPAKASMEERGYVPISDDGRTVFIDGIGDVQLRYPTDYKPAAPGQEPVMPAYPADAWVRAFFGEPDEAGRYYFSGDFGNIAHRHQKAALASQSADATRCSGSCRLETGGQRCSDCGYAPADGQARQGTDKVDAQPIGTADTPESREAFEQACRRAGWHPVRSTFAIEDEYDSFYTHGKFSEWYEGWKLAHAIPDATQPDPAMPGDKWLAEFESLLNRYRDSQHSGGLDVRINARQSIKAHARERVQPALLAEPILNTRTDDDAVEHFAVAMKEKLAQARAKGRRGWHEYDPADLSAMLREHVDKGDPRDVANFCMFLWSLGKPISAEQPPSDESLRLLSVIADKIEDGTLFQAGIFSRRDLADKVRAVLNRARYGQPAQPALEAVEGDLLPPIGSDVLIHLASCDKWVAHTVVGYYVWGDLKGNESLQRVFIRVRDAAGFLNARLLKDVRKPDGARIIDARKQSASSV